MSSSRLRMENARRGAPLIDSCAPREEEHSAETLVARERSTLARAYDRPGTVPLDAACYESACGEAARPGKAV